MNHQMTLTETIKMKEFEDKIIEGMKSPLTGPLTLADVEEMYKKIKK